MAIKSFNSADINNISKQDGRYNVIENISGAKRTLNPPAAAYSVRKLTGLTGVPYDGPAMRILVDATGDGPDATDLEFDINFTADGDLDVADIELKCTGGKDAYVVKWYDQSGAGNDATQTAYASMPKICSAGSVILENGQPAVEFNTNNLQLPTAVWNKGDHSIFMVTLGNGNNQQYYNLSPDFAANWAITAATSFTNSVAVRLWTDATNRDTDSASLTNGTQFLLSSLSDVSTFTIEGYIDGTAMTGNINAGGSVDHMTLGARDNANGEALDGVIQEFVLFADYKNSTEKSDIENNINSYFNIYQSRENILPGAAAAYSLRQLSDSSRLAVRVRRDTGVGSGTDDDEADVGFDANGEVSLDSPVSNFDPTGSAATTLGEFLADAAYDDKDSLGAPAQGLVTAWYDQSVNANNATQATPDAQPKIYDSSTGLIKENGKPAVEFDGTNDSLSKLFNTGVSDEMDCFVIAKDITHIQYRGIYSLAPNNPANRDWNDAGGRFIQMDSTVGSKQFYGNTSDLSITHGSGTSQYLIETAMNAGTGYFWHSSSETELTDAYTYTPLEAKGVTLASRWTNNSSITSYCNINMCEFILHPSYQGANRGNIRSNINAHYGIANFGTPSSGLLADYPGSTAAYSVRKLADTAGLAMRIIVDDTAVIGTVDASDTEYDIGFDANGDLDVARIREVCNNPSGANYNAYVVTWYDQSGNGNHATQTTYTNCPQIYNGTSVITENGKPMLQSNDSSDGFSAISVDMSGSTISLFSVSRMEANNSIMMYLIPPVDERIFLGTSGSTIVDGGEDGFTTTSANLYFNGSSQGNSATRGEVYDQFYQNQTLGTWVGLSGVNGTAIYLSQAQSYWQMHSMQELIIYETDQSSNRKAIETDIDSYYRIYGDPDDGLLSTPYGKGAAAAYSVRRLSNNATRAMRILVDADANGPDASDNEYDIGFDVNGELDIARIEELCDKGTGNYDAYVTTWYDQSGEGNDATQATYSAMPKICDAGTVILENGKPALDFNGANMVNAASATQPNTIFHTHTWPLQDGGDYILFDGLASGDRQAMGVDSDFGVRLFADTGIFGTDPMTAGDQTISSCLFNGASSTLHLNGSAVSGIGTGTQGVNGHTIGAGFSGALKPNRKHQEFIMYDSDQSSNRTLIEANINDYFDIEGV